ncbi:MAG: alkaline phosphatase D family protein [Planctomycetaceae bacterium]
MKHLLVVAVAFLSNAASAQIYTAQGSMAGEVTAHSVLLQTRLTTIPGPTLDDSGDIPGATGVVCFEYSLRADFQEVTRTEWMPAIAERDFIVRAEVTDLQAEQRYHYRPVFGTSEQNARPGTAAQFQTLPGGNSPKPVSFIVGSCQNYAFFMYGKKGEGGSASENDRQLGYPSYAAMKALNPDFFVGTGDIVYYDHPKKTAAQTLPELRKKWHEQARFPRLIDFFATTATYWSKDDHDFRYNDSDLLKDKQPLPETGIEMFREQMPIHPAGDNTSPTYRTHRINRHLQIWLTEGRDFRSPNKMPDGPDKSLWGKEQRQWLEQTLKDSDATWKILISPTPLVGPDDAYKTDNHVNLGGFRHEADAFFEWLTSNNISGFMTICGDRHWQYHSIHPSGVEEFGCGALNDENARNGVAPGSKKGTDPDALIRQPYTYAEPTGGFLHLRVVRDKSTPALVIEHRDDTGAILNTVTK